MLCYRYGNPALFVELSLACGRFAAGIDAMYDAEEHDKLWAIYLRTDMQQSFDDWRASVVRKVKQQDGMTGAELVAAQKTALDILKRCKPPE